MFFSNYEISVPNTLDEKSQEIFNQSSFFSGKQLPHLLDFYRLYLIDPNTNQISKIIELETIEKIACSTYNEDLLPGFNFHIITQNRLYIFSCSKSEMIFSIVKGLKIAQNLYKIKEKHNLLQGVQNAKNLIQMLSKFNLDEFYSQIKEELIPRAISEDSTKIDINSLHQVFRNLKRYIKILKYHPVNHIHLQDFLIIFFKTFSNGLKKKGFELTSSELFLLFRALNKFNFQLEKYSIKDISFKRFLISINSSVFDQLNDKIMQAIVGFLKEFFLEPEKASTFYKRNFYAYIFDFILTEFSSFELHVKLTIDIVYKSIEYTNQECFNQIVYNSDLSCIQLIYLLNSCIRFSKEFFDFVRRIKSENVDSKFANSLENLLLQRQINSLVHVLFNEIQIRLEEEMICFFDNNPKFIDLNFSELLTQQLLTNIVKLEKNLFGFLFQICMNDFLHFLLHVYFVRIFESLADHDNEINIHKKLVEDKDILHTFFEKFIDKHNLKGQLDNIDFLCNLLINSNRDQLLTSLIKFDIFFGNQLLPETISALIEKNFNISIKTEDQILQYFASKKGFPCSKSPNGSFLNGSFLKNESFRRKQIQNQIYFPTLTISLFLKIKLWAYRARASVFNNLRKESHNVSLDCDLVNNSVNEHYLENNVKVIFIEGDVFRQDEFETLLKVNLKGT